MRPLPLSCRGVQLQILIRIFFFGLAAAVQVKMQLSADLANSVCSQMRAHREGGQIQSPVRQRPHHQSSCGWHIFSQCESNNCVYSNYERCNNDFQPQIVGGKDVKPPNKYPSMLGLKKGGTRNVCGATIINKNWVITAAHCLEHTNANGVTFLAGDHNRVKDDGTEQEVGVKRIIIHADFRKSGTYLGNDIALCELKKPFKFNKAAAPVVLPEPKYRVDGYTTAVGWGATKEGGSGSNILQEVDLSVISDKRCQEIYKQYPMIESQLCTLEKNKDGCQGDSGGPIYKIKDGKHILVGITSWGRGCARDDGPGVWTEVAYFIDWIREKMAS